MCLIRLIIHSQFRRTKPIGVAKGLYPGRVVWVQNDDATNENYVPKYKW